MIKKALYLAIVVFAAGTFVACGDKDDKSLPYIPKDSNEYILDVMTKNYAWNLPDPSPTMNAYSNDYFNSLLSSNDSYTYVDPSTGNTSTRRFSNITEISKVTTQSSSLDAGFEYAAVQYSGNVYNYVILYVKPGSPAEKASLKRGYIITKVGSKDQNMAETMETVTKDNWRTLLPNKIKSGEYFNMLIRVPNSVETMFGLTATTPVTQSPLYKSAYFTSEANSKKIGYMVLNDFLNASSYKDEVANKLKEFRSNGVNSLIIDLRYNSSGGYGYLQSFADELVKSGDKQNNYFTYLTTSNNNNPSKALVQFTDNYAKPNLGDQLEHIYVITGQKTAAYAMTLVHSLRAYWGNNITVYGEEAQDYKTYNMAISGLLYDTETQSTANWVFQIALGYLADKNQNYDYRTSPNVEIAEINSTAGTTTVLKELGDHEEVILAAILAEIIGTRSLSTATYSAIDAPRVLGTSIETNIEGINISDLKY